MKKAVSGQQSAVSQKGILLWLWQTAER